jgi:flavin-dependent dehydrogenase
VRSTLKSHDVAIIGAGTAGSAAAALCAQAGLEVICLERGPLDQAGARWCNGVPPWAFDEAGIPRPEAPELRGSPASLLIAGWGPERIRLDTGVLEVDMRLLVQRLQGMAREAGATLRGGCAVRGWEGQALRTDEGTVQARWVIDASGLRGAGLIAVPKVAREDLCTAAQEVRRLVDPAAARAWFDARGASPDDVVIFTGIAGGYSILNVRVHGDEVALLTGSIPALGHPAGAVILERFVQEQPWIGPKLFGGGGAIPIRRPFTRLHEDRVALIGDAACQVFSAHGSGIAAQLVAARILADVLSSGGTVADYSARFQRRFGGELAASDVFCRLSRDLSVDDLRRLMRSGLLDAELAAGAVRQRKPDLGGRALLRLVAGALRAPDVAARVLPSVARMELARRVYALHPVRPLRSERWPRLVRAVTGVAY